MHPSVRHILGFFLHYGVFGLLLLTIADDSFLFLPVGGDLLIVLLVARNHAQLPLYVLAGAAGSTAGVFILDLICRKGGEEGLKRFVKPKMHAYLKRQMEKHAGIAVFVTAFSPPPFPFGAAIAVASALQYPRPRLLGIVFFTRVLHFGLIAWAALHWGRAIIRITETSGFLWFMGLFIAFCIIGSTFEIIHWVRGARKSPEVSDKIAGR